MFTIARCNGNWNDITIAAARRHTFPPAYPLEWLCGGNSEIGRSFCRILFLNKTSKSFSYISSNDILYNPRQYNYLPFPSWSSYYLWKWLFLVRDKIFLNTDPLTFWVVCPVHHAKHDRLKATVTRIEIAYILHNDNKTGSCEILQLCLGLGLITIIFHSLK